jgi:hypothetical protein
MARQDTPREVTYHKERRLRNIKFHYFPFSMLTYFSLPVTLKPNGRGSTPYPCNVDHQIYVVPLHQEYAYMPYLN